MRVFVTGANVFIGSTTVRALVDGGHDVVCLLRDGSRTDRIEKLPFTRAGGDVRDSSSLRKGMTGCDATLHLAAPGGWSDDDPRLLREVIEDGTRNVLSVALTIPNHRVVYVSSSAAIAASDEPRIFDESAEFNVTSPQLLYAHAKHRAEGLVRDAVARGLDAVIVNPGEVYGPGDTQLGTAGNLIDFAKSWPVLVCRGGTAIVHVADVAAGILAALAHGKSGERYILSADNLSIVDLARMVVAKLGRRVPVIMIPTRLARLSARIAARFHIPFPYNPHVVAYATRYWFVDNRKARAELGVEFRSARKTIDETLDWLAVSGHIRAARASHG
jgi:dihydroflavonol-4-reductase